MDSSSRFQPEAISGGVDFSPVFLMDVIMILLVSLFVIFYFNRLIAWVTNFGLRFVFWHKHRIRVKVQSVQISLLGGRIFFKNLTYIGTNQTICFLKGHFTWRYWLWKSRKSELQMSEDSESNVTPEKLQSRLALEVDGLEWFVYNRTPAYDAVFEQFQARHKANAESKCENNDTLQTAHTTTSYEPKNFSFGEQIYLDLFPIDLKVHKGSMVVGNRDTQSVWMFHFKNATGLVDVAPTPSYLDRYRQVYRADFEHPVVEMRPNIDYKGMDSTQFEHKPKVKKSLWAKTYENEPNTSKLRRSLRAIRAVLLARALPDNESEHSREGMPWMGLSRYLTQDTEYYVEDDKNEGAFEDYARVPQILDAPSGSLTMYYDVQGQVPQIEGVGAKDSPQWGMKITATNATINYGPSTERQRTDLHQMLIPRTCIDAVPSPKPLPGDLRPYEQFRVDVEFQEEMILRVPIREESKNLEFANLFRDDPGANTKRPFGWMEIKTNNTVTVEEIQSMEATKDGWAHTVSINLGQTEVRTSVNHGLLFTGDHVSLECDLSTPLEWNGLCDWKFDLQSSSVKLFLLDEHITLFSDLTNDFGSDTPVPYTLFTPYKYTFHWGVSHFCNIYLNINDANIINNPTDFEDNTFLVFESDALDIDFSLPLDQIHQSLNEASFKISAPIMDFNLSVPPWHTLDSFLETEKMGRAYEFAIVGTYSYYSSFDKEHTDSMHVEIYGTDVTMVAHGIFVCYLMKVIDNYFGINTKFQTMEEYAQRDAPKVVDPVNFIKEKNDMDVVVDTFITNGVIVLPANLYSTREYLRLDFPSLDIDCRFTNYYMDLQSNIAPIRGRCVTEATTKAYMLARESHSRTLGEVQPHIYIDGIDVHGHRLFGRPPEEPTYYCKWDFHLGDIQIRGPMSAIAVLGQAADCFDYGFDDTENKLLMAIPLLFDVTFVSAKINSLTFRLETDPGAVEVLTSAVAFKLNDLNNSDYTARASVKIPWIQLSVMTNEEVLSQLTTSVLVTDYIQKRNMDDRRGKQQEHIRLHDDSFGRCDFLLTHKYAPDAKPYTIVPTLPLPPLAEPLTDENINSLGTAGIFSTYKKRENYDIAQSSLSSASTNSHRLSIDSSFMTRSSGISRISRSRNSYKIRKFRRPRIENKFLAPKPWRKASKTAVSDIDVDPDFAQDFFASKMRPGMSASRETPDEDTETDNIVVQLGKIGGTLTPAALTVVLAIMAQTPQDGFHVTLDKLQIQVMKKLNYILSGQPETKNIRVVIPGVDIEMKASPGGSEEYVHLQMGTIDIMVRDNVHKRPQSIEDYIQDTMDGNEPRENSLIVYGSMDLTLEVVKSSHTIGPSPNPLVLGLTQFEFWLNQDVSNSASAQIKELDVSLDNQQLEWLLRNTDRQLDRLKLLLDDIPNQNKATQSDRTKDVVYSLALAGQQFDITSDPSTLTKPAYIIRLSQQHVRAHDSWKILIRLRHILQTVPAAWYAHKEKQLIHGDCKVPVDARTKVINVFKKWRFWEINSIPKSYLFLHVFPPESKRAITMTTRVLVDVDGIGLRLLFAECENYLLFDYVQVYVDVSEGDDHVIDADAGVCVASIRTHFSLEIVDTIQTIARYVDATKPSSDDETDQDTTRPSTGDVLKIEVPQSPLSMSTSMISDKSTTTPEPDKSVSPGPEKVASKSPPIRVMVNTLLSSWVVSIKSSAITLSVSGQEFLNSVFVEKTGDDLINDVAVILTGTFGSTGMELIATETDEQVVSYAINSTAASIAFGKSIHVTCDTQNMLLTVSQDLLTLVKLTTQFFEHDWEVIDKLIEELSGEEDIKAHHTPGSAAAAAADAADELKEELCEEPGPLKDIIPFLDRVSFRYSLTSLQCSSMLMPNWVYANEFRNMQVVVGSGIDSRTTLNGSFEVGEQMHEVRNHSSGDSQIVLGIALSAVSALGGSVITEEFALLDCALRFGIFDAQTVSPSMLTRYLASENERECVKQMSDAIDDLQEILKKRISKGGGETTEIPVSSKQNTPSTPSYPLHFTTQILADRFSFTIPALDSSLCLECDKVSALAYNFVMSEKTKAIEHTALTGAVTPDHVRFLLQNKRLPGGVATLVDLHIRISLYEYIKSGERKRGADIESEFIRICLSSPSLLKLMEILTNIEGDISLLEWESDDKSPKRKSPKRKMSRDSVDSKVSHESFVSAESEPAIVEEEPESRQETASPAIDSGDDDSTSSDSPLQNWRIRTSFEQVTFGWLFPPNSGFNGIVFGCDNVAVVALSGYGQLRLKGVYITPAHGNKDTDFFPDKVFPTHANTVYLPRLLVTFATLDTREYHLRILGEELKGTILPSIVEIVSCTATTIKQTVKELELLSKERNKRLEKSNSSVRVVEPNTAPSDSSLLSIDHSFVFRADAKFQGAVVSLWSESEYAMEMYAETRHIQASSGGRRSTARVVESSPELYLQAPALEAKVDFRHNTGSANKELLKFGVTVEPSSNTLYPRMIPVVLDIVSGMRTLLEDKSDKHKDLKLDLKSEIKKVKIETPQPQQPSKDLTFSEWDITAGIQIERQELIMSCEPTARVSASLSYQNLSLNMTTVDASEEGLGKFFSFTCRLHEFNCSLQHTYSREISAMVGIDEILCVVNKDKEVDPALANTWNVAVSIVDVIADINVKHTQDLKLFQELWLSEMPEKEKEVKVNTDPERFVLKYHRATSGTRICWNATVSNVKFSADLGQSIGKVTVGLDRFWLLTDKKEHLDQHITLGFELIKIHSDGRLGGMVSLARFRLELALLWEIDEDAQVTPEDVPLVTLVASLASAEIRMAFDYQQFGIASIKNLGFSVSNQREVADYLSAIVDIEQICVFITVLAPSNILDLVQILVRTKQGIEGAYEEEVGASNEETPSKEKKVGRPHLLTSVDVSINSGTLQVYPSTLLDTQVLYVNLSGTHAKFVCDTQKRGLVKSHLELGMHEFIIALSTFKTQINEEDLLTLTVDEFVAHTRRAKGGTIVRIPKVDINMHTWQYDTNPTEVKFTYSSEFAGKVDIGWNFGSVTFIREMWNSHAKAFASRREAYKLNFVANPSVLKDGELEEKLKDVALDEKYVYVALEPPNIEIPQLRDMGEATPPIEWIGLHRQRFPGLTHQVVIVGLQGLVKEVEVAYFTVLGA
ncbi:YALIA101S05e10088g1_1 [Yarrowia lipolytica]|nr:YALIA101S05e10088g1_1 [Yarrowia lipolytica]